MKAWQFIKDDVTAHGGHVPPSDKKEIYDGGIRLCMAGYHASIRVIDALQYSQGTIVRRVECGGEIIKGRDKIVCTERQELWRIDATNVLHEFSCRCAEDALALVDIPDQRSIAAIAAKRAWLRGEIDDVQLAAARDAAWDAIGSAARAAAEAAEAAAERAARASAWDAARSAARSAARAEEAAAAAAERAARASAWDAAWAAVGDEVGDASRDAAWDAAWDAEVRAALAAGAAAGAAMAAEAAEVQKQNRRLTSMVIAVAKKRGVYK